MQLISAVFRQTPHAPVINRRLAALLAAAACAFADGSAATTSAGVYLEDLTSTEVRDAIRAGKTTIIIPVGGTEQNGPHMVLGKHNVRVKALAGKIAATLGNALVAPVLAYTPEGSLSPPTGHMKFAGTISISDAAFEGLLEGTARSFRLHGFTRVALIGDHGNYQAQLRTVAARLNREWSASPARAFHVEEYYLASQAAYGQALRGRGISDAQIGKHAGAADTSLALAVDASLVRSDRLADAAREGRAAGVDGDPRAASVELGEIGVKLIVEKSVVAIRRAQESHR